MGVEFIVFDGKADFLVVCLTLDLLIVVLSDTTTGLTHKLSDNFIHNFYSLIIVMLSSPIPIINCSIAFFLMVHHWRCYNFLSTDTIITRTILRRILLLKNKNVLV